MKTALRTILAAALIAAVAGSGGCPNQQIYSPNGGTLLPGGVSPNTEWRVSGDLPGLTRAIDGRLDTAALSGPEYRNATVTVDLARPCMFNMLILDHGHNPMGFPRRVAVLTSVNGVDFTPRCTVPGKRRVTTVLLPEFITARYVQFQVVEPGNRPWSLAEVLLQ